MDDLLPPPWVRVEPDIYFAAKRDYHAGDKLTEIAARHGVTTRTLNRWARLGQWVKGKDHRAHETEKQQLARKLIVKGRSAEEVCKRVNISISTYYRWRAQWIEST